MLSISINQVAHTSDQDSACEGRLHLLFDPYRITPESGPQSEYIELRIRNPDGTQALWLNAVQAGALVNFLMSAINHGMHTHQANQ